MDALNNPAKIFKMTPGFLSLFLIQTFRDRQNTFNTVKVVMYFMAGTILTNDLATDKKRHQS